MVLHFSKYSGCGNDFILVDNRKKSFPLHQEGLISELCCRRLGIGADGLILWENATTPQAHHRMRIFNSDGSEAEMCGNGLRCLGRFIKEQGITENHFEIEVSNNLYSLAIDNEGVRVCMPPPSQTESDIEISLSNQTLLMDYVDTGVPHAVVFVQNIDEVDVFSLGQSIRYHARFAPRGVNVNFAVLNQDNSLSLRTYERGVEQETLACGTGAAAVAVRAAQRFGCRDPIMLWTKSRECLSFYLQDPAKMIMKGPAKFIFRGEIDKVNQKGPSMQKSTL